jgi:plasmid stability protein
MATLNIRGLTQDVHQELRLRAARHGRSMEAEARSILSEVCRPSEPAVTAADLQRIVDEMFGSEKPTNMVDEFLRWRREEAWRE